MNAGGVFLTSHMIKLSPEAHAALLREKAKAAEQGRRETYSSVILEALKEEQHEVC